MDRRRPTRPAGGQFEQRLTDRATDGWRRAELMPMDRWRRQGARFRARQLPAKNTEQRTPGRRVPFCTASAGPHGRAARARPPRSPCNAGPDHRDLAGRNQPASRRAPGVQETSSSAAAVRNGTSEVVYGVSAKHVSARVRPTGKLRGRLTC